MKISVVLCTHSLDNYPNMQRAVESILAQTCPAAEIIVVVDGKKELYERIMADYGSGRLKVLLLLETRGISEARNAGIRIATGDVLVFMDDDATAEKDWIEKLAATYQSFDAIAVAGKILPEWTGGPMPDYFPEELYWLVGVTNPGYAQDKVVEVRNAFGANMSFRKAVFDEVGVFNRGFGFTGNAFIQAEEPELSLRMKKRFSRGVTYNPEAIVHHMVPVSKVKIRLLLRRSFWQGYSKALINKLDTSSNALNAEGSYLKFLLLKSIPGRLIRFYHPAQVKKVFVLLLSICGVGLGFIFGSLRRSPGTNGLPKKT